MLVLGLESSCDETAAALYENGRVLSSVVRSQIDLHKQYGGVVPEIASRAHLEAVDLVTREALNRAGRSLADLKGLAVTQGPGLVGALLVALNFAKGLAFATCLPLAGVNHVKAHALAPFMAGPGEALKAEPDFPLAALVVSGGHSNLYRMDDYLRFTQLGGARDDAAGEAFDKTAKLMGLGYPGGQAIEKMAEGGDPEAYKITRPMLHDGLDFSFSGLKTRVLDIYKGEKMAEAGPDDPRLKNLAASFQAAVVDVLVTKLLAAAHGEKVRGAVISGGVAANGALRRAAEKALAAAGLPLYVPPLADCADNGAMIAHLGARQIEAGVGLINLDAEAYPRWPVA